MSLIRKINDSFLKNGWDNFSLFDEFNLNKWFDDNIRMEMTENIVNGQKNSTLYVWLDRHDKNFDDLADSLLEIKNEMKDDITIKLNGIEILPLTNFKSDNLNDLLPEDGNFECGVDLGDENGDKTTECFIDLNVVEDNDIEIEITDSEKEKGKSTLEYQYVMYLKRYKKSNSNKVKEMLVEEMEKMIEEYENLGGTFDEMQKNVNLILEKEEKNDASLENNKENNVNDKCVVNDKPIKLNNFKVEIPQWELFNKDEVYNMNVNNGNVTIFINPFDFRYLKSPYNTNKPIEVGDIILSALNDNGNVIDTIVYSNMVLERKYYYNTFNIRENKDNYFGLELHFVSKKESETLRSKENTTFKLNDGCCDGNCACKF